MYKKFSLFLLLIFLLAGLPLSAQSSTPANPFGVVEGFWLPNTVCELGAGWERIIFDWSQHQPNGPDDWYTLNVDDRWLKAAQDCNREVVAIFKHTPAWATDGMPGPGVPRGLYLPVDDPENVWASFVRRSAEYYAPRGVSRFIIWNEPDITRETYGFEYEGSLDDYFQMLKVAYLALKEGNPEAEILLAGTTYWHDLNAGRRLYLDRLLERITADPQAADNHYYFDIASLHIYFRTETVYDIVRQTRDMLDKYGLTDKRIWINEMNAGPTDDPLWPVVRPQYQINLEQQSAFIMQTAALGLAGGAERIAVYKFYDWNLPPGDETFGLIRADGSRRPAFDTWAAVIQQFEGVEAAALAETEQMTAVWLTLEDGSELYAVWAKTAADVKLSVETSDANVAILDQYGHNLPISTDNNAIALTLAGARCDKQDGCAVGGNVQLVRAKQAVLSEVTSGKTVELGFE
ncbi:MAG: hypothetical protein LCI00_05260 [Chloroflexi bacterium]|nr:hypothetical protein [Chloroflexota bacterium]MCC6896460.1 hypothetical protein [Anaerolineae bacterium]